MKAEAMSLTFLGNEGQFKIPFFQRGYVWSKDNWDDLLEGLLDFKKSHFLGSLVLKILPKQIGKHSEVLVIDGQQRLTTLSILIRSLFDSFKDEPQTQADLESSIKDHLFFKKSLASGQYFVKIEHSKIDKKYFEKVIKNEVSKDEYDATKDELIKTASKSKDKTKPKNKNSDKVLQCYIHFSEKLKEIEFDVRLELFERLLHPENKILVVISLSDKEDNEQAIFDTINSAGVRLSSADIIKNALFQKALEIFNNVKEVETLYKNHWENNFSSDDEAINFWDAPRPTRDNIEVLLHAIAVIKGFFDPDRHFLSDLSNLYKDYISKRSKEDLALFIIEISEYAKLFREQILVFNKSSLFEYQDDYARIFHILSVCEISTFHPYILSLFYQHKNNEDKLKEELRKLESLMVRRMITGSETKSYNRMCKEFIKNNAAIDTRLAEQTEDKIKKGLSDISNKSAALLLFWVELYRRNKDSKQSIEGLKYAYSLEHIMPQKWEQYWSDIDVVDENSTVIADKEKAKKERYSKIYAIGNMTLLNSSLNTSLRNYAFCKKIEGDGRKKGIKHYGDLTITKFGILDKYDSGDKVWNEDKINNRTAELTKDILAIW